MPAAKTTLITGASSGIGLEMARVWAHHGHRLILVSRDATKLDQLAIELRRDYSVGVEVIPQDLSDVSSVEKLAKSVRDRGLKVDTLINNAGFSVYGPFTEQREEDISGLLAVNIEALTLLSRVFLPEMVLSGDGMIINVASTAAYLPGPLMATYYASKAYVLSFTYALAEELDGTGVHVMALSPGITITGFAARAKMQRSKIRHMKAMTAEEVAIAAYEGAARKSRNVVPGFRNWFLTKTIGIMPRHVLAAMARRMQEPEA